MNEKDNALMHRFLQDVCGSENGRRVLLSVKYNQISKINLIILHALIREQGKNGLFITIDRPHNYMTYLLDLNKIPRDRLQFLDIIGRFSGEAPRVDGTRPGGTPFMIGELVDLLESGGGSRDDPRTASIDFGILDFIMIDNLGSMLTYNELADVAKFVQRYMRLVERYGRLFTAIVMDVRAQPDLYRTIQGLCQREFLVSDDGNISPLAAPVSMPPKAAMASEIAESVLFYAPEKRNAGSPSPNPGGA